MDYIGTKRGRKRKRKRRLMNIKQRREQIKLEVMSEKHQKVANERNFCIKKDKVFVSMEANAFWENYKAAHEWQNKHNVTWWKTRCFALEHENHVLKETIRNLLNNQNSHYNVETASKQQSKQQNDVFNEEDENNDDNIEFHLNEGMMDFLEKSILHKIELKNKRESEETVEEETVIEGAAWVLKRNEDAKLLYGDASSKVLAMETALQATIERHVDKAKPKYWPNIPLKL